MHCTSMGVLSQSLVITACSAQQHLVSAQCTPHFCYRLQDALSCLTPCTVCLEQFCCRACLCIMHFPPVSSVTGEKLVLLTSACDMPSSQAVEASCLLHAQRTALYLRRRHLQCSMEAWHFVHGTKLHKALYQHRVFQKQPVVVTAGYSHPVEEVVAELVECLEDPALPLMQFTEAFAVVQVSLLCLTKGSQELCSVVHRVQCVLIRLNPGACIAHIDTHHCGIELSG